MLFGTDGIRGLPPFFLESGLANKLGKALGGLCGRNGLVVVGRDSRTSGEKIEKEFVNGLLAYGVRVLQCGVVPTMAVSRLVRRYGAKYGAMVSASHNPPEYNGIKILDAEGKKLDEAAEAELEKTISTEVLGIPQGLGHAEECRTASKMYADDVLEYLKPDLGGMNVRLDCCHGSCSGIAKAVFMRAGAKVTAICDTQDGDKINVGCGSTCMENICAAMTKNDSIGFSFDGDGDRVLAATRSGRVLNGDYILYILALYLAGKERLKNNTVVGTVMTNYGLEKALLEKDIRLVRTAVGDKYVIEKLSEGYSLGGEPSGHIIVSDALPTGDGIFAAVMFSMALKEFGIDGDGIFGLFRSLPQKIVNIPIERDTAFKLLDCEEFKLCLSQCQDYLCGKGRILVRPSGTEAKLRIMVEGDVRISVEKTARILKNAVLEILKKL